MTDPQSLQQLPADIYKLLEADTDGFWTPYLSRTGTRTHYWKNNFQSSDGIYFDSEPEADYRFLAVNKGYVAIHPQPQGVIQFVGGFFFGGWFAQWWHKNLLRPLFAQKYTIIVNPFANSPDHWGQAIKLISFQQSILAEIREIAKKRAGYDYQIYELSPTSRTGKYFWLGHSVGCKYLALLELLTALENQSVEQALKDTFGEKEAK